MADLSAPTCDNPTRSHSPSAEATARSTLYPKITNKSHELLRAIHKHYHFLDQPIPPSINFTGTVKLHGTHADLLIFPNNRIVCQSRNRTEVTPEADNLGFATFVSKIRPQILLLTARVTDRWRQLHPTSQLDADAGTPMILAGEWIGQGIQKGVAISQLSRRWVLCSLNINGVWEPISDYADIADEEVGLYNISRGGFFSLDLASTVEGAEDFMARARAHTEEVCKSCSFGRLLGAEGAGEGVVYAPAADSPLPNESCFWLKVKGEDFMTFSRLPKAKLDNADAREKARLFAESVCTEPRLEQGWQYLAEMGIERSMKGLGAYLSWVVKDIAVEEKSEIEELGVEKLWKGEVSRIAKEWYLRRLKEEETEDLCKEIDGLGIGAG